MVDANTVFVICIGENETMHLYLLSPGLWLVLRMYLQYFRLRALHISC